MMVVPKYITLNWTSLKAAKIKFCSPEEHEDAINEEQVQTTKTVEFNLSSSTVCEFSYKKDLERRKDELLRQRWRQRYNVAIEPLHSRRSGPFMCPQTIKRWVYEDIKKAVHPDNLAVKFLQEFGHPPCIDEDNWFYWVYLCYNELQDYFNYSWMYKFGFLSKADALADFQCTIEKNPETLQFIKINLMDDPIGYTLLNDREYYTSKYSQDCPDVRCEIDNVYEKFCAQRYWTNFCYFIICRNIEVTDELTDYFSKHGISLADVADAVSEKASLEETNNEVDSQTENPNNKSNVLKLSDSCDPSNTEDQSLEGNKPSESLISDQDSSVCVDDTLDSSAIGSLSNITTDTFINSTIKEGDSGTKKDFKLITCDISLGGCTLENNSEIVSEKEGSDEDLSNLGFEEVTASACKESSEENSSKSSETTVKEVSNDCSINQECNKSTEEDNTDNILNQEVTGLCNIDKDNLVFQVGSSSNGKKKGKSSRRHSGRHYISSVGAAFDYLKDQNDYSFSKACKEKIELPLDFTEENYSSNELNNADDQAVDYEALESVKSKRKLDNDSLTQYKNCSKKGRLSPHSDGMSIYLNNDNNNSELIRCNVIKQDLLGENKYSVRKNSKITLVFSTVGKVVVSAISLFLPSSLKSVCSYFFSSIISRLQTLFVISPSTINDTYDDDHNSILVEPKKTWLQRQNLENALYNVFGSLTLKTKETIIPVLSDKSLAYHVKERKSERSKFREVYKILISNDDCDRSIEINEQSCPWLYLPKKESKRHSIDNSNNDQSRTSSSVLDCLTDTSIVFDNEGNPIQVPIGEDIEEFTRTHVLFDENGDAAQVKRERVDSPVMEDQSYFEVISENTWRSVRHKYTSIDQTGHSTTEELPLGFPVELGKYWAQRHRLFLKFDEGIELDDESWFSATPEMLAAHHAMRCEGSVVVDAFCGAGGNAIQLAMICDKVIAIDIDPNKIVMAKHNAAIYGVQDKIEFIQGDFMKLASTIQDKVHSVIMSPPWGGIGYTKKHELFDVLNLDGAIDCKNLMQVARSLSPNIALFLPRNSNIYQILDLVENGGKVDVESNVYGSKLKSITVYFGDLVNYGKY